MLYLMAPFAKKLKVSLSIIRAVMVLMMYGPEPGTSIFKILTAPLAAPYPIAVLTTQAITEQSNTCFVSRMFRP